MAGMEMMRPDQVAPCTPAPPAPKASGNYKLFNKNEFKTKLVSSMAISRSNDIAEIFAINAKKNKYSSITLDEYEASKVVTKDIEIPFELTQAIKQVSITILHNLVPIQNAEAFADRALEFLSKPVSRMVMGGILAGWSVTMALHASKQAKVSKNRAEFLRKMKDQFNDATGALGCSEAERGNPGAPNCYCYTESGQRNTSRANSAVCTALFTGKSLGSGGSYLVGEKPSCITSTGSEDAACACKSSNTCASINASGSISGLDTGTFSTLTGAVSNLNGIANGNGAGNVSPLGSAATAARLLETANKIAAKSKTGQALLNNKKKLVGQMDASIRASSGNSAPSLGNNSSSLPTSPAQAIAELQKEFKAAESPINTANGGQTLAQPASPSAAEAALDFSFGNEQATEATQVAEVMKQNLDYGQNDITTSKTNIFEVLSNRYQRSGMRRLFDEEGKTKADAPAQSEINQ
jgi:hypothetical protein